MVHRVALFDRGGAITSVISQSDIVRFLADNSDRLGVRMGREGRRGVVDTSLN